MPPYAWLHLSVISPSVYHVARRAQWRRGCHLPGVIEHVDCINRLFFHRVPSRWRSRSRPSQPPHHSRMRRRLLSTDHRAATTAFCDALAELFDQLLPHSRRFVVFGYFNVPGVDGSSLDLQIESLLFRYNLVQHVHRAIDARGRQPLLARPRD